MKRLLHAVVTALAILMSPSALTSTNSTEITDMWWIPTESGWGLNVILQNDTAFLTFFVYDTSSVPFWYVATVVDQGNFTWSGDLYATSGPWFGGPFNPAAVTATRVGTATFHLQTINQATLTYSVDGVVVAKVVQRQNLKNENYSGSYGGGYSSRAAGCSPSSLNGINESVGTITVSQVGTSFSASLLGNPSCTFSGTYSQTGKLGEVVGNYSCNTGEVGTFDLFEMTPTISGFNGGMSGNNNFGCQWIGHFGGITRAQ